MSFDRLRWQYSLRFSLVHAITYALVATSFVALQSALPAADRYALAHFEPYRPVDLDVTLIQLVRGLFVAAILWPFYDRVVRSRDGRRVLFGTLLGLTVIGSVNPMPGSIEGLIYTETPWLAHIAVLAAASLQLAVVATVFLWWERGRTGDVSPEDRPEPVAEQASPGGAYVRRFVTLHAVTYLVAGLVLFQLQNYADVLSTSEEFELYRPLDHPFVMGAVLFQILRGTVLALAVAPFYRRVFPDARGWLMLFGLLWGLTFLAAPNALQGLVTDVLGASPLAELLFGTTEITLQMLVFSWLAWWWERRHLSLEPARG